LFMRKLLLLMLFCFQFSAFAQSNGSVTITGVSDHLINRHIYGQFAEHLGRGIYDGFWVDKNLPVKKQDRIRLDVVEALKKIKIPTCAGPAAVLPMNTTGAMVLARVCKGPRMVNTNWGGVTEDNSFGTHEFLALCQTAEHRALYCG
jgi:alpha-N-arabinofuranosidase